MRNARVELFRRRLQEYLTLRHGNFHAVHPRCLWYNIDRYAHTLTSHRSHMSSYLPKAAFDFKVASCLCLHLLQCYTLRQISQFKPAILSINVKGRELGDNLADGFGSRQW